MKGKCCSQGFWASNAGVCGCMRQRCCHPICQSMVSIERCGYELNSSKYYIIQMCWFRPQGTPDVEPVGHRVLYLKNAVQRVL